MDYPLRCLSKRLVVAYVLPRMLYGLEAIILPQTIVMKLERAYKEILRNIQGLRQNVASVAIYLLIGLLPVQAELHLRILILFGAIMRLDVNAALYQLARRQLATQVNPKSSWFGYVKEIARRYNLLHLVQSSVDIRYSKEEWKALICPTIQDHWFHELQVKALQHSSLAFLDVLHLQVGEHHPVWPMDAPSYGILAASYRAKMLAGSYILQSTRARYNQHEVDPTCPLCNAAVEDPPHFLLECTALSGVRDPLIQKRLVPLANDCEIQIPEGRFERCQFILNGGLKQAKGSNKVSGIQIVHSRHIKFNHLRRSRIVDKIQSVCSTLCYQLHCSRSELLGEQKRLVAP